MEVRRPINGLDRYLVGLRRDRNATSPATTTGRNKLGAYYGRIEKGCKSFKSQQSRVKRHARREGGCEADR